MKKLLIYTLITGILGITSCESPEPDANYTPADYDFPTEATLRTSNIRTDSFQFSYDTDGDNSGTAYYVVVIGGSEAPSNDDVLKGNAEGLIQSGSFELTGGRIITDIVNLCNNTSYTVYTVQLTNDNFLSDTTQSINATTSVKNLEGEYKGYSSILGNNGPEFTTTLTLVDGTTNEYVITTAWGEDFYGWVTDDENNNGTNIYDGTLIINNDNTITIVGNDSWATGGTGTYDNSCLNTFKYQLNQTLTAKPFDTDVELIQIQ